MKGYIYTMVLALFFSVSATAQVVDDDLYFVPKKITKEEREALKAKKEKEEKEKREKAIAAIKAERERLERIDNYNRRGTKRNRPEYKDIEERGEWLNGEFNGSDDDYEEAVRMIRFRNPRFAVSISSPLYYDFRFHTSSSWDWNVYDDGMYLYAFPTYSNPYWWDWKYNRYSWNWNFGWGYDWRWDRYSRWRYGWNYPYYSWYGYYDDYYYPRYYGYYYGYDRYYPRYYNDYSRRNVAYGNNRYRYSDNGYYSARSRAESRSYGVDRTQSSRSRAYDRYDRQSSSRVYDNSSSNRRRNNEYRGYTSDESSRRTTTTRNYEPVERSTRNSGSYDRGSSSRSGGNYGSSSGSSRSGGGYGSSGNSRR